MERAGGYGLQQINPFISEIFEQSMGKDMFTGREIGSETPQELLGLPVNGRVQHLANLVPPVGVLDRLNPGDIWTKVGNKTGAVAGDTRPYRNEPDQAERLTRFILGPKTYRADKDLASMSANERKRKAKSYTTRARKAKTPAEREHFLKMAESYLE